MPVDKLYVPIAGKPWNEDNCLNYMNKTKVALILLY